MKRPHDQPSPSMPAQPVPEAGEKSESEPALPTATTPPLERGEALANAAKELLSQQTSGANDETTQVCALDAQENISAVATHAPAQPPRVRLRQRRGHLPGTRREGACKRATNARRKHIA